MANVAKLLFRTSKCLVEQFFWSRVSSGCQETVTLKKGLAVDGSFLAVVSHQQHLWAPDSLGAVRWSVSVSDYFTI